jgi:lipopolysaccharide transport system permease protein
MFGLTQRHLAMAASDVRAGMFDWRLWNLLAWQDIKQRYRRSTLGPLWLTISTAIQMLVMGTLGSFLFATDYDRYLPYICAGIIFWSMMTNIITDGANAFVNSSSHLTQVRRPLTTFLMQVVWRNTIVLAHNFIIFAVVALIFRVTPGASIFLWPLGLAVVIACVAWMALVAGVIAARFRDIPMIITSLINVLFWLTPLMYFPEQLGRRQYIIEYNPFTHLLALVRAPLLGQTPSLENWLVALAFAICGWAATFLFFARFRSRIVYWL